MERVKIRELTVEQSFSVDFRFPDQINIRRSSNCVIALRNEPSMEELSSLLSRQVCCIITVIPRQISPIWVDKWKSLESKSQFGEQSSGVEEKEQWGSSKATCFHSFHFNNSYDL